MADGKWIPEITAQTPLTDAARWVLSVRLEVVRNHLRLALAESNKDVEHVHQLRVGTRRAGAAVEIFRPCLPDKIYKSIRKHLRGLRRAAGAARDWDVFLTGLRAEKQATAALYQPGLLFLMGYGSSQRIVAQQQLQAACPKCPFDFEQIRTETIAAVRDPREWEGVLTLMDLAKPTLRERLAELGQAVAQDLDNYDNLHQVRIAGKRLRYAMEVFANCFVPQFRNELYPLVEAMQEILGRVNDSHVARERLAGIRAGLSANQLVDRKRIDPGLRRLIHLHEQRLPKERRAFQAWWEQWQQCGGEQAFAELLQASKPASAQRLGPLPGESGAGNAGITGTEPIGGPSAGTGAATPP